MHPHLCPQRPVKLCLKVLRGPVNYFDQSNCLKIENKQQGRKQKIEELVGTYHQNNLLKIFKTIYI